MNTFPAIKRRRFVSFVKKEKKKKPAVGKRHMANMTIISLQRSLVNKR